MSIASRNLLPHHGESILFPDFFSEEESERYFTEISAHSTWKQEPVRIFGKMVMQPRLTASFADDGIVYGYSGIILRSGKWTPALLEIKRQVEAAAGQRFNTALLNLYRDGKDSMGWHRDNEKELGPDPVIASVSFGATRKFQFREFRKRSAIISVMLPNGSLLIMRGASQHHWQHRLPKSPGDTGARINITFRFVLPIRPDHDPAADK